jgi:autotransporter-associated beta strand protein
VAVFDSTVTGITPTEDTTVSPSVFRSYMVLPSAASWQGIRVANAAGVNLSIDSFGQNLPALTIGSAGIDLSAAAAGTDTQLYGQNITLGASQVWSVASGATLDIRSGTLARAAGTVVRINAAPSAISLGSVSASSLISQATTNAPYALFGETDFAAVDATNRVVPGSTAFTYLVPTGTGNITLGNSGVPVDIVNGTGFRLGNSISVAGGVRFNAPPAATGWSIDTASTNRLLTTGSILITQNVGAFNVTAGGAGAGFRTGGNIAGGEFLIHQFNTLGDLILNPGGSINNNNSSTNVTKNGPGRVIVNTTMNNTGIWRILAGTVQIGNSSTTGAFSAATTVINNGALSFKRTNVLNFANAISGTGFISQEGSGETVLTGANTYSGTTKFQAGLITFSSFGNLGTGTTLDFTGGGIRWAAANTTDISTRLVTFGAGGATFDTNGNDVTIAASVGQSGIGGLTKTGAGTLTLAAGNSYSGNTTVNVGTLALANTAGSATGSGNLTVANGATLTGSGIASGSASVAVGGTLAPGLNGVGTITLGGLALTTGSIVNIEFASTSSYDSVVATNLTLNGGGINLYNAGGTSQYAEAGTYALFQHTNAVQGTGAGSLSVLNPKAGFSYSFSDNGSAVSLAIAQDSILSSWSPLVGGSWSDGANWSNGIPTTNFTAQFVAPLTAPSTLTLDGNRTVNGAVFDSANGYTVAQGSSGTLTFDKGLQSAAINVIAGNHTISAPVLLSSTIAVTTGANTSLSFTNNATGAGGVTKSGSGILDFTGDNTFTGDINAFAGVIGFSRAASLGSGALTLNGATLRFNAGNTDDISSRTITVGQDGGTFDTNGNDVAFASAFGNNGTGVFTKTGNGTLSLGGNNTFAGGTNVTGGALRLASDENLGTSGSTLTLNGGGISTGTLSLGSNSTQRPISIGASGGAFAVDDAATLTIGGTFSGGGPWSKTGNGTLLLTGVNNGNSSPITISGGTVRLGGATANVNNGLGTGPITLMGGTLTSNNALVDPSGASTFSNIPNNIIVPTGQTGTINYSGRSDNNGSLTGNGTLNVNVGATRTAFGGNWSAYAGQINIGGTGEFRLNGASIFNNSSVHIGAGVLVQQIFNPPAGGETVQNIGALSGDAGARLGGNPVGGRWVNWTIGSKNLDTTFAGIIQNETEAGNGFGEPRITKVGTGNLTLSGNSTFTGSTTINGGALIISGSLGNATQSSPVTVNALGTLAGTGTITGNVTVNGSLRPDPTYTLGGQLTIGGALNLTANATTIFDVSSSVVAPLTKVNSTLSAGVTYGGSLKINFRGTINNGTYPLFQLTGAPAGGSFNGGVMISNLVTTDAPLTDNTATTGTWDGTVDGATFSFNPSTGALTVTGATEVATPAIPSGLSATGGNNQVSLTWNTAANADVYIVKRAEVSGGPYTALISTQPTPSYVDTTAVNGTTYFYVVASKNNNGLVSADSAEVSATPTAFVPRGLDVWREAQFGLNASNPAIAGDNADPDGDGMVNFLEYATNHNPLVSDGPATTVGNNGTRLTLTYRSVADPFITYTVQGVNDIAGTPAWGNGTIQTTTGVANSNATVTVTDSQLLSASPRRFLRLNVSYPPAP